MRVQDENDLRLERAALNTTTHETSARTGLNTVSATLAALFLVVTAAGATPLQNGTQHLSWADGLSQTTIFSIRDDQQGSVWFATEDGLNRFDGQSFTVYRNDPDNPGSLPANLVRGVDAAPDGRIWAATEGGGVAVFDPATNSFTRFSRNSRNVTPAISSNYNRAVLADRLGSIWIATRSSGLDRLDPAAGLVGNYRSSGNPASLASDEVYVLLESRDGSLFVGTNRGLNRYETTTNSFEHINLGSPAKKTRVRALFEDQAGVLWIGTNGAGLFSFDPLTGAVAHFCNERDDDTSLRDDHVQSILEDGFGQLWVGTASGLNLLDRQDRSFERYGPVDVSATGGSGAVTALHLDRSGTLWVGTELGGLIRWEGPKGHFRDTGRSVSNIVTSFTENRTGRLLYFGTVGKGLVRVRPDGKLKRYKADDDDPQSLADDRVMALLRDSSNRTWVGTMRGGLSRFKPGRESFRNYRHDPADPKSLSADGVMVIHEDPLGRLWVGTFGGGLNAFDAKRSTFFAFRHDPDDSATLGSDRITAILGTRSGLLWVGTDGGGLNLFDPATGLARRFQHDPDDPGSLPTDTICSLFMDTFGTLWVGTRGGGLARMVSEPTDHSEPVFDSLTEADGLPNSVIYSIQPNGDGQLWVSTNHGLSLFDPLMRSFTNFDVNDGLQANEFNFGAAYRGLDGTLYFGGINGYNAFLPLPADTVEGTRADERGRRGGRNPSARTATASAGF